VRANGIGCRRRQHRPDRRNQTVIRGGITATSTGRTVRGCARPTGRARTSALCTGSHILARANMLNGYRCTIHWENLASFSENFPEIEATSELFEVDRNRFTCSGGTAALDMMLNMISQQHGHELAASVSEQFIHERIRDRHDHQRMALTARLGVRHPKLIQVIQLMEQNLEEPLSRQELAEAAGLSSRQMERLFAKYLHRSPARYYVELRLNRARLLCCKPICP
jgi:transcriptional regulator GlxA family with amidase domain